MSLNNEVAPKDIFRQYSECTAYNAGKGLYETVRQNENFFIGKQWEGLNAPDLDKPVLNFLKRVGNYLVAMLVTDDVTAQLVPFVKADKSLKSARALEAQVERVVENTKMKAKLRDMLRNCVVDGDGVFYWYFDSPKCGERRGEIHLEVADNTRVLFGNPFLSDIQKQPFVLITKREQVESVRKRAALFGKRSGEIVPDGAFEGREEKGYSASDLVTVVLKLYRKNDEIWFTEVTKDKVVRPPVNTGYRLYPISFMNWERVRNSYHGQAAITGLIANQIAVNKLWAMAIRHQHTMAFPKIFYDRMKIKEWTNRVGEAVAVTGDPNGAVATSFRAGDMSAQLLEVVDRTISYTKEFMGASDAALGNIKPDNTSAIIAVQKASAAPLELQRLAMYQFIEDSIRIVIELIRAHYGIRIIEKTDGLTGETELFDFSAIDYDELDLKVDVGASAYWSELTQMGTLDNLFAKGVITDALLYLEGVPDGYIKNKSKIIEKLRNETAAMK
ncbi:MAG: hypothetical protein RR368_08385, partial [Oscillospiraceae bacterium]